MIKLVFTRNKLPLSWLIRWLFDSPVSHFALQIDNIVFHSNFNKGGHIVTFNRFKKLNEVVYELELHKDLLEEERVWQAIQPIEGKPWDFLGAAYLGYRGLMYKFFLKPLPANNLWASKDAYMCTEVVEALGLDMKSLDMTDPYRLYLSLSRSL